MPAVHSKDLNSDRRDSRQQTDTNGQHQKTEQKKRHLGHKASEGKGSGRDIPVALDTRVGHGAIVRAVQISVQAQITTKKPYQMPVWPLYQGLLNGVGF
ncbi:hypothetical protein [Pseudomonas poae]|uniref:Uncharacterized protein n=1 Tax=Pseudomonas poae TaxID=200451 RepID=A0A2S9ETE6_9PSED|nr:hypothetical protein [Pseudomonas poae]PRA27878.1 hypothetical protein CQZ97_16290 [Pseudomonas poae]PRC18982.1 hypothetical protein CQZ99_11760 [Pseudomonas poae]